MQKEISCRNVTEVDIIRDLYHSTMECHLKLQLFPQQSIMQTQPAVQFISSLLINLSDNPDQIELAITISGHFYTLKLSTHI